MFTDISLGCFVPLGLQSVNALLSRSVVTSTYYTMWLTLCRSVGEQDLMVKSWLPREHEEFCTVDASGHQGSWFNATGLLHWRMILTTLTMDRDGPSKTNTKLCDDASSHVHLMPAIPPPTKKQLACKHEDSAMALEPEAFKQSTKAVRIPVVTVNYLVMVLCTVAYNPLSNSERNDKAWEY